MYVCIYIYIHMGKFYISIHNRLSSGLERAILSYGHSYSLVNERFGATKTFPTQYSYLMDMWSTMGDMGISWKRSAIQHDIIRYNSWPKPSGRVETSVILEFLLCKITSQPAMIFAGRARRGQGGLSAK